MHPSSSLIVTGGERRYDYNLMAGTLTENFLRDIRVDISILGCDAIDVEFGLSDSNVNEALVKKLAANAARKTVIVTDHSKFGKTALQKVFDLSEADCIISDTIEEEEMVEAIRRQTELILV